MLKRFPEPKFLQGHGTQYKSSMEEGNVFITLYDVTVPKMNIQGYLTQHYHQSWSKILLEIASGELYSPWGGG